MDNRKTIYLDDAIDAIDKRVQFLKDDPVFRRKHGDIDLYGIKPIIRALPSSQPERKKGKWIEKEDPYGFFNSIPVCSECGCTTKMRERYNFCPNCGADMRGEQDDTE